MTTRILYITAIARTQFTFLRGQNEFMSQRGFELHAIASAGEELEQLRWRDGVRVHPVSISRRGLSLADLRSLIGLYRVLREVRPTFVHLSTPKAAFLGAIAATLARVPIRIFLVRGVISGSVTGIRRILYRWTEKLTARLCHRTLIVSHSLQELMKADRTIAADHNGVLEHGMSNGIDAMRFNPAEVTPMRLPDDVRDAGPVVGFVGRLSRDKGIDVLYSAWRDLRDEYASLRLLLVGEWERDDPIDAEIRSSLEADPRVTLTGPVVDVRPYYRAMTVFAFPSCREGFPNAPMEAAAMEVPVVASDAIGCVDAVQDAVTGTLVPAGDAKALAASIKKYIENPQLRRQHGKAGRERVVRDFQPERIWEALYREYVALLEQRGLPVPEASSVHHQQKAA